MKKLLTTAAVLAFASTAHAQDKDRDVTSIVNVKGLTECRDTAWKYYAPIETTCRYSESGDPVKVIWHGGTGRIDALDDGVRLRVKNLLGNNPYSFTYYYTPQGQLPACNSAEVVKLLAQITNKPLGAISSPTVMGSNNGKNICSASILPAPNGQRTYTVEWLDKANAKYWVQITGMLR